MPPPRSIDRPASSKESTLSREATAESRPQVQDDEDSDYRKDVKISQVPPPRFINRPASSKEGPLSREAAESRPQVQDDVDSDYIDRDRNKRPPRVRSSARKDADEEKEGDAVSEESDLDGAIAPDYVDITPFLGTKRQLRHRKMFGLPVDGRTTTQGM